MKVNGIELKDAGYMPQESQVVPDHPEAKPEKKYPSLYVNSKEVPAIKGLKVGTEMLMVAKVRVTGYSEDKSEQEEGKTQEKCTASFKFLQVGFGPIKTKKKPEDMTDEELAKGETEVKDEGDDY
jgi:hypothetical protein